MKALSLNQSVLVIAFLFTIITSCEKSIDVKDAAINETTASQEDVQAGRLFNCNSCLVTHTSDGQFDISFSYNKAGNPGSISIAGFGTIKAQYDKLFRLQKEIYSNGARADFKYKGLRDRLPVAMYYYDPGGVLYIDSFKYNKSGQLSVRTETPPNPRFFNKYEYYYNPSGNVEMVLLTFLDGTFYRSYWSYNHAEYDDKPNYMTGSPWTKFLFFHTSFDDIDGHLYLLFSKNNATKYQLPSYTTGSAYHYNSTIKYNSNGFAKEINTVLTDDNGQIEGTTTTTSSSICDANATLSNSSAPSK